MKFVNKKIFYYIIIMPPKTKTKTKTKQKQKQKQKQTQNVTVNIGKSKSTGGAQRRAPSSQNNIQPPPAPIIMQGPPQQQTDYTPILAAMMQHQTRSLAQQPQTVNNITPLPTPQPTPEPLTQQPPQQPPQQPTIEQRRELAAAAAERRAGRTAESFQPRPSVASMETQTEPPKQPPLPPLPPPPYSYLEYKEYKKLSDEMLREQTASGGGNIPVAEATPLGKTVHGIPIREGDPQFSERLIEAKGFSVQSPGSRRTKEQLSSLSPEELAEEKKTKAAEASKAQAEAKAKFRKTIEDKLDRKETLTQQEMRILMETKISQRLRKKLIDNGYEQFLD